MAESTQDGEAVSRRAHNPENVGSNPAPATTPQPDGALDGALTRLLGRSWKTTTAGAAFTLSTGIVSLSIAMPGAIPPLVVGIAAVLVSLSGGAGLMAAKDKGVSGTAR